MLGQVLGGLRLRSSRERAGAQDLPRSLPVVESGSWSERVTALVAFFVGHFEVALRLKVTTGRTSKRLEQRGRQPLKKAEP